MLAATSSYLCGSERTFDQAVIFPVPATHLGHRLIVDLHDICGEIEISPHEGRTDAIGIDWNPFVFESQDLVNIESTRGNDADLTKAFVVESHADVADKLRSHSGLLLAIGIVGQRNIYQLFRGIQSHGPELVAECPCHLERSPHTIVFKIDQRHQGVSGKVSAKRWVASTVLP